MKKLKLLARDYEYDEGDECFLKRVGNSSVIVNLKWEYQLKVENTSLSGNMVNFDESLDLLDKILGKTQCE